MSPSTGVLEGGGARGSYARIPELTAAGLAHGFSCRDLEPQAGDAEARSAAASAALLAHLGHAGATPVHLRQRHTARVHRVEGAAWPQPPPIGDALITERPGVALGLGTADCLPLLIVAPAPGPAGSAAAAVHAGWRGTLDGILPATVARLRDEFGVDPGALRVGIGPAIRDCCFEVGPEVAAAFVARWPGAARRLRPGPRGRPHLDLAGVNRDQAEGAGVPAAAFLDPGWCTRCRSDLFHSFRADGPGCGRIVTIALLAGRPGAW